MQKETQVVLEYTRGDDISIPIQIVDENDLPLDISDWTVFFTVKQKLSDVDDDAKIKKTITSHTDPTNGETQIALSRSDSNLIGSYLFDLQVLTDNDEIKTIIPDGIIIFKRDVTQRIS